MRDEIRKELLARKWYHCCCYNCGGEMKFPDSLSRQNVLNVGSPTRSPDLKTSIASIVKRNPVADFFFFLSVPGLSWIVFSSAFSSVGMSLYSLFISDGLMARIFLTLTAPSLLCLHVLVWWLIQVSCCCGFKYSQFCLKKKRESKRDVFKST